MYKQVFTAAAILSMSQAAFAEKSDVWKCVDSVTLQAKQGCVAETFAANIDNNHFYGQLKPFEVKSNADAFATITYFPNQNLIKVKSLEGDIKVNTKAVLLASR